MGNFYPLPFNLDPIVTPFNIHPFALTKRYILRLNCGNLVMLIYEMRLPWLYAELTF